MEVPDLKIKIWRHFSNKIFDMEKIRVLFDFIKTTIYVLSHYEVTKLDEKKNESDK